jgi:hypothetical protein
MSDKYHYRSLLFILAIGLKEAAVVAYLEYGDPRVHPLRYVYGLS